MTGTRDDEDFTPEQIASELERIAELLRQGPMGPAELEKLRARLQNFAKLISQSPDPSLPKRLRDLAEQLRTSPSKSKNGSAA